MDDDDDDDYLSDAILARLENPRPLTYTERQTKRQVQHVARQAQEMRDAEARRRVKARLAHEGEADARSRGLLTNVLEAPAVGSGTLAAQRMMQAMGYDGSGASPLSPDLRWLDSRRGLGPTDRTPPEAPPSVDAFRQAMMSDATHRHQEHLLRLARNACRMLDEEHHGETYSPYWLDPTSLPTTHPLYQTRCVTPTDDACDMLTEALESAERHDDAYAFCALPTDERLRRTIRYLRETHQYCVYCAQATLETCPGETESDHDG